MLRPIVSGNHSSPSGHLGLPNPRLARVGATTLTEDLDGAATEVGSQSPDSSTNSTTTIFETP